MHNLKKKKNIKLENSTVSYIDNTLGKLIEILERPFLGEERCFEEIRKIPDLKGKDIYSLLLKALTHLDFTEKEAISHWSSIVKHKENIKKILNRDPGIRVAIFDYFSNIDKQFTNPKMIEMAVYSETEKQAVTDSLTGLYNYKFFRVILKKELERAKRTKVQLSLMLIDVDDFKFFNDSFGHLNGDMVLKTIAKIMNETIRTPDYLFRYGGEEFAIIFPNTDKNSALLPAQRLREAIENYVYKDIFIPNGEAITVSAGIASYPIDSTDEVVLIKKADQALYHAKYRGKNQVTLFTTNRREYFRLELIRKITYEALVPVKKQSIGKLQNVSEGGLSFLSKYEIMVGTNLKVSVPINDKYKFLDLVGRVVRYEKLTSKNKQFKFRVGIEFMKLHTDDKSRLKDIVKSNVNANLT